MRLVVALKMRQITPVEKFWHRIEWILPPGFARPPRRGRLGLRILCRNGKG